MQPEGERSSPFFSSRAERLERGRLACASYLLHGLSDELQQLEAVVIRSSHNISSDISRYETGSMDYKDSWHSCGYHVTRLPGVPSAAGNGPQSVGTYRRRPGYSSLRFHLG